MFSQVNENPGFSTLFILYSEILLMSKEYFNKGRKLCKSWKCLDNEAMLRWSVVFVYIEFIEIVDRMIRFIKRSLYVVTLCKNDLRFLSGKMFVSLKKRRLLKSEVFERHVWVFINLFKFLLICLQLSWVVFMFDTLLMPSAGRLQKRMVCLSNSISVDIYLTTNPDTTSHLRRSLPRQCPKAFSRQPLTSTSLKFLFLF